MTTERVPPGNARTPPSDADGSSTATRVEGGGLPLPAPAALRATALSDRTIAAADGRELLVMRADGMGVAYVNGQRLLAAYRALADKAAAYDALVVEHAELRKRALPLIDPETDDTMGKEIPITQSRLFDLVRYARYWLQDKGVISMGEWTWLVVASTGPQPGSPSRVRLEENDGLRAERDALAARVAGVEQLRDSWQALIDSAEGRRDSYFFRRNALILARGLANIMRPTSTPAPPAQEGPKKFCVLCGTFVAQSHDHPREAGRREQE
jgi:hypothetical protein